MAILTRAKSSIYGLTGDLSTIYSRISSFADGALTNLDTSSKANLVSAINEVLATSNAQDGDLAALTTSNKSDLVSAINALKSYLDATFPTIANNLGDLDDAEAARANIDVYSTGEVDDAITAAKLALGTNFSVADIAARGALSELTVGDNAFVVDDGDGKWAIYKVTAVTDGAGSSSTWEKIMDEDVYLNAQSASAVKATYESNANTNAYTDAEQTKVGYLSVTSAIDLDKVVQNDELVTDATLAGVSDTQIPSAAAAKAFALEAARLGGSLPYLENVVVSGSSITLTHAPKGGLAGVMNFATVRFVDSASGVAYDAPVVDAGDASGKVFNVSTDSAGQWDGETVQVQYMYVVAA